ncbi:MAG: PD-(D/E)XK nuclease family protein, partial [Clostridia bacterium]|nr:PD-(D/E)XK nuclease family protein [Clostridia bacterium]
MKEIIVFAPGINASEFSKNLAYHNAGRINMRVTGAVELARLALLRSGIIIKDKIAGKKETIKYVADAAKTEDYFKGCNYSDLKHLADSIRTLRYLSEDDEEREIEDALGKGIFKEKNRAILNVYRKYIKLIKDESSIDSVMLITKAVNECKPFIGSEFVVLKEYPLKPLEKKLLDTLSGGKYRSCSLSEIYGKESKKLEISSYTSCYGSSNEVEMIIESIYNSGHIDNAVVAAADRNTYSQLFFDYALKYDIPVSFGCGIPVVNSNPARLLSLYRNWISGNLFTGESLRKMMESTCFKRSVFLDEVTSDGIDERILLDYLFALNPTADHDINEGKLKAFREAYVGDPAYTEALKKALRELELPVHEFILKYSVIRHGKELLEKLDASALLAVTDELSGLEESGDDAIESIFSMRVAKDSSEAGKIYVTGIQEALTSLRHDLYIAGMSQDNYPGSPVEDYLLLDDDIDCFGKENIYIKSKDRVMRKHDVFFMLIKLAMALENSVHISYSRFNVTELKEMNASSLVSELYMMEKGDNPDAPEFEKAVKKISYFEPEIALSRYIGKAYVDGNTFSEADSETTVHSIPDLLERRWSPSAVETFFDCPKKFMLKYVLYIDEPEEDKPLEVISARDTGTLAHKRLEDLAKNYVLEDEFLEISEKAFDDYIKLNPPIISDKVNEEKEAFMEMMNTAYDMNPECEILLKEKDVEAVHPEGIKLHGLPDRVEKVGDSVKVVDFKTGRNIKHEDFNPRTLIQVRIYQFILESLGNKITDGEYRYIRLCEKVAVRDYYTDIDKEMKEFK